jgi:hypothetical protein
VSRSRIWRIILTGTVLGASLGALDEVSAFAANVPYKDSSSSGALGFCDANGHEVTSGLITDQPLASFAVSSYRPPAPFDQPDGSATVFAYQPREGVAPGAWSGLQLTAASTYTVPQYPKVEVLSADKTISNMVTSYPPQWDGILQLRMYFGAPGQSIFKGHYPTADIQISGKAWKILRGGGVSCTKSGSASSVLRLISPDLVGGPSANSGTTSAPPTAASKDVPGAVESNSPETASSSKPISSSRSWMLSLVALGVLGVVGGSLAGYRKFGHRLHPR